MTTMAQAMGKKREQSPQYDFLWKVELPEVSNVSPEDINHRIETFDSPFFELETTKVTAKNSFWYSASNNDVGQISMTVHDMEDGATLQYFLEWYKLIVNNDGTYNPPATYKKPIKFHRLSARYQEILHTYTYLQFFVTDIQTLSNTYESNDFTKFNVTLTGDSVKHDIISDESWWGSLLPI